GRERRGVDGGRFGAVGRAPQSLAAPRAEALESARYRQQLPSARGEPGAASQVADVGCPLAYGYQTLSLGLAQPGDISQTQTHGQQRVAGFERAVPTADARVDGQN